MNTEKNKQKNFFFDYVKSLLNQNKEDYLKCFEQFINSENILVDWDNPTKEQKLLLEAFGTFSFLTNDYLNVIVNKLLGNSNPEINKQAQVVIDNLQNKLVECGITTSEFNIFLNATNSIAKLGSNLDSKDQAEIIVNKINNETALLKDKISDIVKIKPSLLLLLEDFFYNSGLVVDVNLVESLKQLKDKISENKMSYHDIILINSFIMDKGLFIGDDDIKQITTILTNPDYISLLDIALNYFDNQKYALLFNGAILQTFEKIASVKNGKDIYLENILSIEDDTFASIKREVVADNKKTLLKTIPISNNDSIFIYLYKTMNNIGINEFDGKKKIDYPILFMSAVESLKNSENKEQIVNILSNALQTPCVPADRLIWTGDKLAGIKSALDRKMNDYNLDFQTKIKDYVNEIDPTKREIIITMINNLIANSLILNDNSDVEVRGMLLEQLNENKIFTFQHLNQFNEVLESCKIKTNKIDEYIAYVNFIKSDKTINEILDNSYKCKQIQEDGNYYILFSKLVEHINKQKVPSQNMKKV